MPDPSLFVTSSNATALPLLSTETVIFKARRNILLMLFPVILILILGIILAFVVEVLGFGHVETNILRLAIIVVAIFIDFIVLLDWLTTVYLLTNRRVQFRFGIVGEKTKTITLGQISDTNVEIPVLGRLFNYGSVVIEAANINSKIIFQGISSAESHKNQIDDARMG